MHAFNCNGFVGDPTEVEAMKLKERKPYRHRNIRRSQIQSKLPILKGGLLCEEISVL